MNRFVPREKLGKKAQKELAARQRTLWEASPVTKKIDSKKLYSRKRRSRIRWDDSDTGSFFGFLAVTG